MKRNILLQNYSNLTSGTGGGANTGVLTDPSVVQPPAPIAQPQTQQLVVQPPAPVAIQQPTTTSLTAVQIARRAALNQLIAKTGALNNPPIPAPVPLIVAPTLTTPISPSLPTGGGGGGSDDSSNQTTTINKNKMTTTKEQWIAASIGATVGVIAGWLIGKKGSHSLMFAGIGAAGLGAAGFFGYPKFATSTSSFNADNFQNKQSGFNSDNYVSKHSNFNSNQFEAKSGFKDGDKMGGDCYLHGAWQKCATAAVGGKKTIISSTLSNSGSLSNTGASRNL